MINLSFSYYFLLYSQILVISVLPYIFRYENINPTQKTLIFVWEFLLFLILINIFIYPSWVAKDKPPTPSTPTPSKKKIKTHSPNPNPTTFPQNPKKNKESTLFVIQDLQNQEARRKQQLITKRDQSHLRASPIPINCTFLLTQKPSAE